MNVLKMLIGCVLSGCLLSACNSGTPRHADVSKVEINYQSFPFYQDFLALDAQHLPQGVPELVHKYPDFAPFFFDTLMSGVPLHKVSQNMDSNLYYLLTYPDFRALYDTLRKVYPNTESVDNSLKNMFKRIKLFDTTIVLPIHVFYFTTALNGYSVVLQNEKNLGIGLDMFLGKDYLPYQQIGLPAFETVKHTPRHIPIWAARLLSEDRYGMAEEAETLLEIMLNKGKQIYFIQQTVAEVDMADILGYTPEQWQWCEDNQAMIYYFFVQKELLYEKNRQKIGRFIVPGPVTPGLPPQAPGDIGSYLGWKIVESYLKHESRDWYALTSIQQAQDILQKSKYKP